jgi:hypothetical protein
MIIIDGAKGIFQISLIECTFLLIAIGYTMIRILKCMLWMLEKMIEKEAIRQYKAEKLKRYKRKLYKRKGG